MDRATTQKIMVEAPAKTFKKQQAQEMAWTPEADNLMIGTIRPILMTGNNNQRPQTH